MRIAMIMSLVALCRGMPVAGQDLPPTKDLPAAVVAEIPFTTTRPQAEISSVSLSSDAKYVAVSSRVWEPEPADVMDVFDVATGRPVRLSLAKDETAGFAGFSPDGKFVAVGTRRPGMRHALRVLDLMGKKWVYHFETKGWATGPIVFTADSKSVIRPGRDAGDTTFAFERVGLSDGKTLARVIPDRGQLARGAFHELLVSASGDHLLTRQDEWVLGWNLRTGGQTLDWTWTGNGAPAAMAIVPGTTHLRVAMQEGTVVTLDYTSSREVSRVRLDLPAIEPDTPRQVPFIRPWSLQNVAFSDDAKVLLKAEPGRILRWEVGTGQNLAPALINQGPHAFAYMGSMVAGIVVVNKSGDRRSDLCVVRVTVPTE